MRFDEVEIVQAGAYAAQAARVVLALHAALAPQIAADERLAHVYGSIEIPVSAVLSNCARQHTAERKIPRPTSRCRTQNRVYAYSLHLRYTLRH